MGRHAVDRIAIALDPASGRPLGPPLPTGGSPSRLAAGGRVCGRSTAHALRCSQCSATPRACSARSRWAATRRRRRRRRRRVGPQLGRGCRPRDPAAGPARSRAPGGQRSGRPRRTPTCSSAGAESGRLSRIDVARRRLAGPPVLLGGVPAAVAVTGDDLGRRRRARHGHEGRPARRQACRCADRGRPPAGRRGRRRGRCLRADTRRPHARANRRGAR